MDTKTAKKIKSKNTKIEKLLGKALWNKGFRYRKNDTTIFGKPDFVFKRKKIAVFCDSKFWHGYNYLYKSEVFKKNSDFWQKKILRNIQRDKEVNQNLEQAGWKVLRFWDDEIMTNIDICLEKIVIELTKLDK